MTAAEIMSALRAHFREDRGWVLFEELRAGTGYGRLAEQRIDAWAMNVWPSKKFHKIAFEIKVSKNDFLRELQHPQKRRFAMTVSNEFYFVAPKGVIDPTQIPDGCGLMEVWSAGVSTTLIAAKRLAAEPSWLFFSSLVRRLQYRTEVKGGER